VNDRPSSDSDINQVKADRFRRVLAGANEVIVTNLVITLTLCVFVNAAASQGAIFGWLFMVLVLNSPLTAVVNLYQRRPRDDSEMQTWGRYFMAGCLLSGLAWGLAPFMLLDDFASPYNFLIYFTLIGVCASVSGLYSSGPTITALFVISALLPVAVVFYTDGRDLYMAMGVFFALFTIGAIYVSIRRESLPGVLPRDVRTPPDDDNTLTGQAQDDRSDRDRAQAAKRDLLASLDQQPSSPASRGQSAAGAAGDKIQRLEDAGIDSRIGLASFDNNLLEYQGHLAMVYENNAADFEQVFVCLDNDNHTQALEIVRNLRQVLERIGALELQYRLVELEPALGSGEPLDDMIMSCQVRHIAMLEGIAVYLSDVADA
jgi:hypothetical protein